MKLALPRILAVAGCVALGIGLLVSGCAQSPVESEAPQSIDVRGTPRTSVAAPTSAFTDFGGYLAKSRRTATGISATLFDTRGAELAQLQWHETDAQIKLSSIDSAELVGPDNGEPLTLKGSTYAVFYYYGQVQKALELQSTTDLGKIADAMKAPGCDFFPDQWETPCIKACCAAHDFCWKVAGCTMLSWLGIGNPICKACNVGVVACIGACVIVDVVTEVLEPILGG